MLRSEPNANKSYNPFKSTNKLTIINESEFSVKYEAHIYEGKSLVEMENDISAAGFSARNKVNFSKAEPLYAERGIVPHNSTNYVTVGSSKKVKIRYFYIGLHDDYTDEQRNFTAYDILKFTQPTQLEINTILLKKEESRKLAEESRLLEEKARVLEEKARVLENKNKTCASLMKHMCSPDDYPKTKCPRCKHWFCNWHIEINNNILGKSGHLCK